MPFENPAELPYRDDPTVREIYADNTRMTTFFGGAVRIELVVARPELEGQNKSGYSWVPSAKLVLAPPAAFALHDQLSKLMKKLEEDGVLRRIAEMPGTKQ